MKIIQTINTISWKIIFVYALTTIFLFSLVFYFISIYSPLNGLSAAGAAVIGADLSTALYFSIVTFSSLGYGDVVPLGLSRAFAMLEVLLGLLFIGTLVSKLVSMRQERLLTSLYRLEYISHFRSIRHELSDKRFRIENASLRLYFDPKDKEHIGEVYELFKGEIGIFRQINSTLSGLAGFLKSEKVRDEPIFKELESYHFERVLGSIDLTLKGTFDALERFKEVKYSAWKTKATQQDLKLMVKHSGDIVDFISEEFKSKEIEALGSEVKRISRSLKKEAG